MSCNLYRLLALLGCLGLSVIWALQSGSVFLTPAQVWQALWQPAAVEWAPIIYDLRLPRILAAVTVGGLLALAGALLQILLKNPLADPYLLGTSGGASIGALLAMGAHAGSYGVSLAAWAGALISTGLVFGLAIRPYQPWQSTRLLLSGVMVASACGAMISLILVLQAQPELYSMLFWLMGDLSLVAAPSWQILILILGLGMAWLNARDLNILSLGELEAQRLGVAVKPLRIGLYLLSALLTALAVTLAGNIGFIGLMVPHLVRLWLGYDYHWLLPAGVLAGSSLLVLADTLARTLLAPQQLPVGVVTALLGIPIFLALFWSQKAE